MGTAFYLVGALLIALIYIIDVWQKQRNKMAEKTMASLIKSDAKRLKKLGHFGY